MELEGKVLCDICRNDASETWFPFPCTGPHEPEKRICLDCSIAIRNFVDSMTHAANRRIMNASNRLRHRPWIE